jgi:Family of unknown function (DUF6439)
MPDFMLESTDLVKLTNLDDLSTLQLAQALMERLTITPNDWHKLKSNRPSRSGEQAAAAIVFLLKDRPEEALLRLQQATAWLDRSISAPPCPSHGLADKVAKAD